MKKEIENQEPTFYDELEAIEKEIGKTLIVSYTDEEDTKSKEFDMARNDNGALDVVGKFKRFRLKVQREKSYLINMELRNGNHTHFVVFTPYPHFIYMKGKYLIDDEMKYYDVSSGLFCLDYHQDLSLPIKRKIPFNDIRKIISASGITEVETAINPSSLKAFQESSLIEGVMKGQEIDEAIKKLMLIAIIGTVASVGIALYLIAESGALQGVIG